MTDQSRVPEALRWKIIYPLARLFPRWCWATLVMWAAYGFKDRLTESKSAGEDCRNGPDTLREGACYCGKFTSTK